MNYPIKKAMSSDPEFSTKDLGSDIRIRIEHASYPDLDQCVEYFHGENIGTIRKRLAELLNVSDEAIQLTRDGISLQNKDVAADRLKYKIFNIRDVLTTGSARYNNNKIRSFFA